VSARYLAVFGVLVWCVASAQAQHATPDGGIAHHHFHSASGTASERVIDTEPFVRAAREGSARYRDRRVAIREGYRLLGPDFPAMGEHWVHPGRMVDGVMDADRPQALSYIVLAGEPVLTGVIFARPLAPDESPPAFPYAGLPWHDHVGAVDEESVLLHHAMSSDGAGFRLSMLHAWIWTDNPDGLFAADNWSLPFVRLGLPVPDTIRIGSARALSLLGGGEPYHLMLLRALTGADPDSAAGAAVILGSLRDATARWLDARDAADEPIASEDLEMLDAWWTDAWLRIAAGLPSERAERVLAALVVTHPRAVER
jgi:hypothetical protein